MPTYSEISAATTIGFNIGWWSGFFAALAVGTALTGALVLIVARRDIPPLRTRDEIRADILAREEAAGHKAAKAVAEKRWKGTP